MIGFNPVLDAPATAGYHREAIEQITQCVEEGVYCALLRSPVVRKDPPTATSSNRIWPSS